MENYLGRMVHAVIDRPLGSMHPKYDFIYSLNYGYIPNTISGDGEEIDVYIIGEFDPLEKYDGYVVAIIKREDDIEDKLVVCKQLNKYSKEQIQALVEFQERFFKSTIVTINDNR
ncbi:MAG: inorganic diphosphatase [Bacillaceae bacterium]